MVQGSGEGWRDRDCSPGSEGPPEAAEKSGLEIRREQHVEAEDLDGPDARSSLVDVTGAQPNDEGPSAVTYDVDAEDEVDDGGGSPRRDLKQLAKDQMGRLNT